MRNGGIAPLNSLGGLPPHYNGWLHTCAADRGASGAVVRGAALPPSNGVSHTSRRAVRTPPAVTHRAIDQNPCTDRWCRQPAGLHALTRTVHRHHPQRLRCHRTHVLPPQGRPRVSPPDTTGSRAAFCLSSNSSSHSPSFAGAFESHANAVWLRRGVGGVLASSVNARFFFVVESKQH